MHYEPNLEQAPWSILLGPECPIGMLFDKKTPLHPLRGFWSVLDMLKLRATCTALRGGQTTKEFLTALLKVGFKIDVGLSFYDQGVPMPVSFLQDRYTDQLKRWKNNMKVTPMPGRDPDQPKKEWLSLCLEEAFRQQLLRALVHTAERCGCVVAGSYALHDHLRQTKANNADWIPGDVDVFGSPEAVREFANAVMDWAPSAKGSMSNSRRPPYGVEPRDRAGPEEDYSFEYLRETETVNLHPHGMPYSLDNISAYLLGGPPAAARAMAFDDSDLQPWLDAARGDMLLDPELIVPLYEAGWLTGTVGTEPPAYKMRSSNRFLFFSHYFPLHLQPGKDDRGDHELKAGPLYRRHFEVNTITIDQPIKDPVQLLNGFDLDPAKVSVRLPPHEIMYKHTFGEGAEEAIAKRVMRRTRACFRPCQIVTRPGGKPFFLVPNGPLDRLGERVLKYEERGFRLEQRR